MVTYKNIAGVAAKAGAPARQRDVSVARRRFTAGRNRLVTDAFREIKNTFSRFLSILVLSALAVAFLSGLRAAAPDMQYTADNYYDRTHMMDGYVLSTLGLTQEDLDALAAAEGVEQVEGARTLDAIASDCIVSVRSLPERINLPEVREGRLPQAADECVTERLLLIMLGLEVGGTLELTLDKGNEGDLERTSYTIVGVVECPLYVGADRGASSLGSGRVDGFVFVPGENFTFDYFTTAYFTGSGLAALDSYGDEYEDRAEVLIDSLDGLASERAQLRYDDVIGNSQQELNDARAEFEDARAEAERELADAWRELQDARQELDDGWADYREGQDALKRELANARQELADARKQLENGAAQLEEGRRQYEIGVAAYEQGVREYENGVQLYEQGMAAYRAGLAEYRLGLVVYGVGAAQQRTLQVIVDTSQAEYDSLLARVERGELTGLAYVVAMGRLNTLRTLIDSSKSRLDEGLSGSLPSTSQLTMAWMVLEAARTQLEQTQAILESGRVRLEESRVLLQETNRQLEEGWKELASGWADYAEGVTALAQAEQDGERELAAALEQLNDGEAQYAEGLAEYEAGRAEAEETFADIQRELDDAQAELDRMGDGQWYVLGRNTNAGFVSFAQDTERISNLAAIFPVIFFLVAALACLTTMTRMVEEQRTQIGALKALGFSRLSISTKYLGYALLASLIGGLLGLAIGCTLIPAVIANAFNIMYAMPSLQFRDQTVLCVLAVLAAVACTTGAALWACLSTLMDTPANLMRPRAPKAGRRVLLERVGFVWRRLTFTWKVTMRNLFRYQRRFWMTVIGIGGCTALIVTGFGLHESIFSILNKQFDHVFLYGATLGIDSGAGEEKLEAVEQYLNRSPWVEDYLPASAFRLEASAGGPAQSVTMFAIDDQDRFTQFIRLNHRLDDEPVVLPEHASKASDRAGAGSDNGVVITEKLSELLGVSVGDTITLDGDRRVQVRVADIAENYVQHYIYLSGTGYRELFGEEPEQNEILLRYTDGVAAAESDTVSIDLMAMEAVTSYSYIATLRDTFTDSMEAIDYAVIIIIIAAAALAFVVLYNLTNINITERTRELATLKVLGFFDQETTAYVYRENIFLTAFGILLGLVLGRLLHAWMVVTVEVDIVMFGRTAPPYAYVLAAVLTAAFSVMVNIAAHFKLKKVDMVESLKTVE